MFELVDLAEINERTALEGFKQLRKEAGLFEYKHIEDLQAMLSDKKAREGELSPAETRMSGIIGIHDYEEDLLHSIQALTGAVHEFSRPPCLLTARQYKNCIKSLDKIKELLSGSFDERRESLVRNILACAVSTH